MILKMIPRQSRQISFCNEFDQTSQIIPAPGGLVLTINNILVTIILIFFTIDDSAANNILLSNQNVNKTMLYGKYGYNYDMSSFGYGAYMYCYFICVTIYLIACPYWCICGPGCGFMLNILGAGFSIPLVYPYLKDQIIGPDYQIIQCDQIDSLGSWQDQWCANHQRRIILSWLLIFVWFTMFFIYLFITLLIVLIVLCKVSYRISKLWVIYQYQYRKGLFSTWLKEQKEKSRQQIESTTVKPVKSNMVNNEINIVEVVTIE